MQSLIRLSTLCLFSSLFLMGSCDSENPDPREEITPEMSIASLTRFEGDDASTFSFLVSINRTSSTDVTVDYATESHTAAEGEDFLQASGTLTILAGERSAMIDVQIVADTLKEADEEFYMNLSNVSGATLVTDRGTATIRNDDTYVFVPADGYITPDNYAGFDLVWADEFDEPQINRENWIYEIGDNGWGNQELQYYTERLDNSRIQDGQLIIEARKENFNGAPYTSARMITRDLQEFTYGRVDVRAVLPEGQGIWPAIWMLGAKFTEVGWPACGEIDIMELVGHEPSTVHGTAHWGPQGQSFSQNKGQSTVLTEGKFSDQFHVFSILWEPDRIIWLLNDEEFFRLNKSDVNGTYPFNEPFFFLLNIAVGGQWPGNPDETTVFPQQMIVDYIRIFQED